MLQVFYSVDPVTALSNPVTFFHRYRYANSNPYRFTDPDGRAGMETMQETMAWGDIDYVRANTLTAEDATRGLVIIRDIFLSQFGDAPGGGLAAVPKALARGVAAEARVLKSMGEVKNTEKVVTSQGRTIPDFQNARQVGEIKDTQRVSNTTQMRAQREHATATGREHVVVAGRDAKVSKPLAEQSTVIRRDDLGPQK